MSQDIDVIRYLAQLALGAFVPNCPFFEEGNKTVPYLTKYGIGEIDDKNFLHLPSAVFPCHVFGCKRQFDSVNEYQHHYNSCHRYTCTQCKKVLQSAHLLDLHVSEAHDSFFAVLSLKKPMFACLIEECLMTFETPQLRRTHCLQDHNFPNNFVFTDCKNRTSKPKKKKEVRNQADSMDVDVKQGRKTEVKVLGKGSNIPRKRIFTDFVKDLTNNLPTSE